MIDEIMCKHSLRVCISLSSIVILTPTIPLEMNTLLLLILTFVNNVAE